MICPCLRPLELDIIASGHAETLRGAVWTRNCREWVYYPVILDTGALAARFHFPACVSVHENTDQKSGLERGFVCDIHHDAIMGRVSGAPVYA